MNEIPDKEEILKELKFFKKAMAGSSRQKTYKIISYIRAMLFVKYNVPRSEYRAWINEVKINNKIKKETEEKNIP